MMRTVVLLLERSSTHTPGWITEWAYSALAQKHKWLCTVLKGHSLITAL